MWSGEQPGRRQARTGGRRSGGCWLLGSGLLWDVLGRTSELSVCGGWGEVQSEDLTLNKHLGVRFAASFSLSLICVIPKFFQFYLLIIS